MEVEKRAPTHVLNYAGCDVVVLKKNDRYVIICGSKLSRLSAIDRNKAVTMLRVVEEQSRASPQNTNGYQRKVRSVAADRAGYHDLTEAILATIRAAGFALLLWHCLAHIFYSIFKVGLYTKELIDIGISGLLAVSLSMKPGGSITAFKKAVMQAISDNIEVVQHVYISRDAMAYKEWVFVFFFFRQGPRVRGVETCSPADVSR